MIEFAKKLWALLKSYKAAKSDYVLVTGLTRRQLLKAAAASVGIAALPVIPLKLLEDKNDGLWDLTGETFSAGGQTMTLDDLLDAIEKLKEWDPDPGPVLMHKDDYARLQETIAAQDHYPSVPGVRMMSLDGVQVEKSIIAKPGEPLSTWFGWPSDGHYTKLFDFTGKKRKT